MTLNIKNKRSLLLIAAVALFIVVSFTGVGVTAGCEYRYYYVSLDYGKDYNNERIRIMEMIVFDAYIYDLPNLPASWVYDIINYDDPDGLVSFMSAAAKSDNHTIEYKDLEDFVILRQPKNKSGKDDIHIKLTILEMMGKESTIIKHYDTDDKDFTVQKIDKCLPEKPKKH